MQVQLEIPDDILHSLATSADEAPRAALEAVALEGYRTRRLSEEQVRRMLGFESRFDVHAFLKANNTHLNYGVDDFEDDMRTLEALRQRFPVTG
jgi:hypothetical protein